MDGTDLIGWLRDGIVLCNLANRLRPGCCAMPSKGKQPFICMNNISQFLSACQTLGVPRDTLFDAVDIYESKNVARAIKALLSCRSLVGSGAAAAGVASPHPAAMKVVAPTPVACVTPTRQQRETTIKAQPVQLQSTPIRVVAPVISRAVRTPSRVAATSVAEAATQVVSRSTLPTTTLPTTTTKTVEATKMVKKATATTPLRVGATAARPMKFTPTKPFVTAASTVDDVPPVSDAADCSVSFV